MNNVLSYSQERFWFLHQLDPKCVYYHECAPLRMLGPLNTQLLESVLAEIVRRHHILRTNFRFHRDRPTQIVNSRVNFTCPMVDLIGIPAKQRDQALRNQMLTGVQQPFDLEADLPVRATLFRCHELEHVLLLTMHHIASDTWSLGVMLSELQVLWAAWSQGRPSELSELAFQYADFAKWEQEFVQGKMLDKELDYWKKQLAGIPKSLDLPTDQPRPRTPCSHGAREAFSLSDLLSEKIRSLAHQQGITLFMVLLAAFKVLIHRYTDATDLIVGSPIANRKCLNTEIMLGPFLNVVLLRTDLSGDPCFRQLIRQVKEMCVAAYSHKELPLQTVIRQTPELHGSQSHPFQIMFTLQNSPLPELRLGNLELQVIDLDKLTSVFEMDMQVWDSQSHFYGWLHYRTDLFAETTIRRLISNFETLLQGVVDDPDCPVWQLPVLSPDQLQQQSRWNDTQVDIPEDVCIHELIEKQVQQTPDAAVVVFEDDVVTYRDLNNRANQLARHLRSVGVRPDVLVGVCMERSINMVVALLGILKAGGVYLPLDPAYPAERLTMLVEDAQPQCVLGDVGCRDLPFDVHMVGTELSADWDKSDLCSGVTANNLAYVIYTSGSTGTPKGVAITHRAVCNRLIWMQAAYQINENDRVLQKTPFTFDVSVWEFFWPLFNGATLVVAKPDCHRDSGYLVDTVCQHQITCMHFVPSMLAAFLQTRHVETCRTLRRVICSGEELSTELKKDFFSTFDVPLYNLYGPTEAAVDVTEWQCNPADTIVPIGRPIANTQLYILDKHQQLIPVGVHGELYIGGIQVARGYLRRPDLTAERFVPDSFADKPGRRLYRTGDAVKYNTDGNVRFIGRLDYQIKLHGVRIELREIEIELERHFSVQQAIVGTRPAPHKTLQLVAYVLQRVGQSPSTSELKRFLRNRLPESMIPATIVFIHRFPILSNGKVDRKSLAGVIVDPDNGEGMPVNHVSPESDLQQRMLDVWQQLFGKNQIGIEDNFFDLGGHSMMAAQFINKMYTEYGTDISMSQLFDAPTIVSLSEVVETTMWVEGGQKPEIIAGDEHRDEYEF